MHNTLHAQSHFFVQVVTFLKSKRFFKLFKKKILFYHINISSEQNLGNMTENWHFYINSNMLIAYMDLKKFHHDTIKKTIMGKEREY